MRLVRVGVVVSLALMGVACESDSPAEPGGMTQVDGGGAGGADSDGGTGGQPGPGTGNGNQPGPGPDGGAEPAACETDQDCVGQCNAITALGCACSETVMGGKVCKARCESDADCPEGGPFELTCDEEGLCNPAQQPGPDAGPGPGPDAGPGPGPDGGPGPGPDGGPGPGPDGGPGPGPDGGPGPGPTGPVDCTSQADCEAAGACPPAAAKGCGCTTAGPSGDMKCIPQCDTAEDCPPNPNFTFMCGSDGFCKPEGGPNPP